MTLYLRAMLAALISAWLAITGLVLLGGWHLAVVEVLCLEVAAVALAVLALAFFVADSRRGCGHDVDCSQTWGGR